MGKLLKNINPLRSVKVVLIFALFTGGILLTKPKAAQAYCCGGCCSCTSSAFGTDAQNWPETEFTISMYIYRKLKIDHQYYWFDFEFWQQHVLPLFVHIANQLATVGTMQVMAIGQFMDAQQQLEAQRDLQVMHAKTNKNYQTSVGMCEFATRIESLAASERKGEANALILSERSTDRLLGAKGTAASGGTQDDIATRSALFQGKFCNVFDNHGTLYDFCSSLNPPQSAKKKENFNGDVDYQKTVESPWTIDFNLTGVSSASSAPVDNDKIVAMADNLYGFDAFERPKGSKMKGSLKSASTEAQQNYLSLRALVAKTKVAENSFNALMAMKGEGTAGSKKYIQSYLKELGVSSSDVTNFLGENPSYNAQMEVLTKKAYQSPIFYTNLYDTPANVERKGAAMNAIGLIQKFDLLKSYLRTEASLSVLLELSVAQLQRQVESNVQSFEGGGGKVKKSN